MYAETGNKEQCEVCGAKQANQHTLSQSAACDGIKNGYLSQAVGKQMAQRCKG